MSAVLDAANRKLYETSRAELARLGYQVHELSCGGFIVARHDFSQYAPDLRAVQCVAHRLTGGNA